MEAVIARNGKTERIEIRLTPEGAQRVDEWRRHQIDHPSRAEAVCRLVETGLGAQNAGNDSHLIYLAVQMLADLQAKLGVDPDKDDAFDADFVRRMVCDGHMWALDWLYHMPGQLGWPEAPPAVQEVCDILEMFDLMECGFDALPQDEREERMEECRFKGFDGNNESEQMHIARILVEDLGRWERFKGRATGNTHYPVLEAYRRMLRVFHPMKPGAQQRPGCTASEIGALLDARDRR